MKKLPGLSQILIWTSLIVFTVCSAANAQTGLKFDGINDHANLGPGPDFGWTNEFTVECWIKQSVNGNIPAYVSAWEDSANGYWSGWWIGGDSGRAYWWVGGPGFNNYGYDLIGTTNITTNTWRHVAGTFKNDTMKLYVDGVLEGTMFAPNNWVKCDTQVWSGNDVGNDLYNGYIDDIRIWTVARTASQIAQYKDSCLTGDEQGLVGLYHFELGSGTSKVKNHAALTNQGFLVNMDTILAWDSGLVCTMCDITAPTSEMTSASTCDSITSPSGTYVWNSTGTYLDTIPNSVGCDSFITMNLTVTQVDTGTTVQSDTIFASQLGATYRWLNCDSNFTMVPGQINEFFVAPDNQNYAVEITFNGCLDTSACKSSLLTSVEDPGIMFKVYPNPATRIIRIENQAKEVYACMLFDSKGKNVWSNEISGKAAIDVSDFPNGIYTLLISSKTKSEVSKFIVQH